MGKPERKARERIVSSSSYFFRCFGISRRFHSDKPIVDVGHQDVIKKKRKMRPHWLIWRPIKFRLKNSQNEITLTPIIETEKQKTNVEDDKQNLFRVIRHVTDRKHIAAYGYNNYKAVEHENNPKDKNEEKDINPDPLSLLGNDDRCHEGISTTCRGGKIELTKSVGSGSRSKKKSIRVRKESRVDPIIGILIITLTLVIMLMWGRLCAILCTSTWCYFLPRLKQAATVVVKRKRTNSGQDEGFLGYLDLNSQAYKKKVVLEGFLDRQHRISL